MSDDIYIKLAKEAIEAYLFDKDFSTGLIATELKNQKAGCFVSIHLKSNRELRGCIGTILPTKENLADEIISNAVSACNDPRFLPIQKEEFRDLDILVDVLSTPQNIKSKTELDPKKYGVIVRASDGEQSGVLLPDLEGINSADDQIQIAADKAGIDLKNIKIDLYRFTVERHKE